jgi:hypothetical protein
MPVKYETSARCLLFRLVICQAPLLSFFTESRSFCATNFPAGQCSAPVHFGRRWYSAESVCASALIIMSDVGMEWNVEVKPGRILILAVCRRYDCNRRLCSRHKINELLIRSKGHRCSYLSPPVLVCFHVKVGVWILCLSTFQSALQ